MTVYTFQNATTPDEPITNFDPATDKLVFTNHSAAEVYLANGFTLGGIGIDIDKIPAGSTSFLSFIDGSRFIIGDGTISDVADGLSNNTTSLATAGDDVVFGLGGNDTLNGGEGSDLIYGNAGNDSIGTIQQALPGNSAALGTDTIFGGQGNDTIGLYDSDDASILYGNLGNDLIYGSNGGILAYGGGGDDTVTGGEGDDTLFGNVGADLIIDYQGDNTIFGGQDNDTIGSDDLDRFPSFAPSKFDGQNLAYGNNGDDLIAAMNGDGDTLYGGQGNDTIQAGYGDDLLFGNAGNDMFDAGYGNIVFPQNISVDNSQDTVIGGAGNDTLAAYGTIDEDIIFSDFNADEDVVILASTTAADLASNAYGGSIVDVNSRGNLFKAAAIVLNGDNGMVTLANAAGQTLDGDNLILSGGSVFVFNVGGTAGSFDGSDTNDFMIAGDAGDTLTAVSGDDTLIGGDGNDLFVMGADLDDDDALMGGDGTDSITATVGNESEVGVTLDSIEHVKLSWSGDTGMAAFTVFSGSDVTVDGSSFTVGQNLYVYGGSVSDGLQIITGTGDDTLFGSYDTLAGDTMTAGDGNDELLGRYGNDVLNGQAGMDTLQGDEGADSMTGGAGADTFVLYNAHTGFTLASVDHVTDFAAGEDKFYTDYAVETLFDERLVSLSGSTDLADAAADIYAATSGITAEAAIVFVFGDRTYVYINDVTAGFSTADDVLVDITGFTGTLTTDNFILPN